MEKKQYCYLKLRFGKFVAELGSDFVELGLNDVFLFDEPRPLRLKLPFQLLK